MTSSPNPHESPRSRPEVLADAVVSAYVHEISDRHRPAAPPVPRQADGADR